MSWVLVWFVFWLKCIRSFSCVLGSFLVCHAGQIHAVPLLCPGFLSGLSYGSTSCCPASASWILAWFVLGMKFMQPHSCVLVSCLVCFRNTIHAVTLLCPGFLSSLSSGSNSCGRTPVSWILVCFVFWVNFMRSRFCFSGSCLVCLMVQLHAFPLLCPGFLSGLSSGSNSCGHTPVSWVLVWLLSGSTSCGPTPVP